MNARKLIFQSIILLFFFFIKSCSNPSFQEKRLVSDEVIYSLIETWKFGAKFNLKNVEVHDFEKSALLKNFVKDNALFFVLPGDTCNPCLERELSNFLEWKISLDKYILGLNTRDNYLLELKRNHPELKGVFVIQNIDDFDDLVLLPHIVFYHHSSDTYLNYASVKSNNYHFDFFKVVIENL